MSQLLGVLDLGHRSYLETLHLQRAVREARLMGALHHDVLILVEHSPVYTMGRGTRASSLPETAAMLHARGAEVVEVERGGDVTWHGEGQLVGYPILKLSDHREDLHWYLRSLETMLINALDACGLVGEPSEGKTGVWVSGKKIASMGVHVRRWVTLHGFALNVAPELRWFDAIVPCGIAGVEMTSLEKELGGGAPLHHWQAACNAVVDSMRKTFAFTEVVELPEGWADQWMQTAEPCDSTAIRPPFMPYG